jgi:hypothetical protein
MGLSGFADSRAANSHSSFPRRARRAVWLAAAGELPYGSRHHLKPTLPELFGAV